jgi:hypothetical protein
MARFVSLVLRFPPCTTTFVTRGLPSGSPRTETLCSREAAYKPILRQSGAESVQDDPGVPTPASAFFTMLEAGLASA